MTDIGLEGLTRFLKRGIKDGYFWKAYNSLPIQVEEIEPVQFRN